MRPRSKAIATYLQTFILVAVALSGSLLAYRVVSAYATSTGGPAIRMETASIRLGDGVAVERLTVTDAGTTGFPFIQVLNPDMPPGDSYCYTLASVTGEDGGGTCPSTSLDPTSVRVAANLTTGSTVVVTVLIEGDGLSQRAYPVLVTAPGADVVSEQVVASPA